MVTLWGALIDLLGALFRDLNASLVNLTRRFKASQEPTSKGNHDSVRPVIGPQFREDVFHMAFDCVLGYGQLLGDDFVGASACHLSEDFDFAIGQVIRVNVFCDVRGYFPRYPLQP